MSANKNTAKGNSPTPANAGGLARFHYCPECPTDSRDNLVPIKAVMTMPGRRIHYRCPAGHEFRRGQTLLRSSPKAL